MHSAVDRSRASWTACDDGTTDIRRVLLATDLSPVSDLATDWALALARQHDAALLVVSVIDDRGSRRSAGSDEPAIDRVRDRRRIAARTVADRGRRIGVPVVTLVWTGEPGESIVEAAAAEAVDVVVVGAREGRSAGGLGSVSDHVARHAPCPVFVVRDMPRRMVG